MSKELLVFACENFLPVNIFHLGGIGLETEVIDKAENGKAENSKVKNGNVKNDYQISSLSQL